MNGLLDHPDSHLFVALADWEYPVSREWIILAHHLDFAASANRKNKPIPKPWKKGHRVGKTSMTRAEAMAHLAANAGRG